MAKLKTIGLLGGLGPEAGSRVYSLIIKSAQEKLNAVQDTDYPPVIMYSAGIDGFDETGIVNQNMVLSKLIDGVKLLENAGADFIIIACNTVHLFINTLRSTVSIPVLSIVEETVKAVSLHDGTLALLGSQTTLETGLYSNAFESAGIDHLVPKQDHFPKLTSVILDVMGGSISTSSFDGVLELVSDLKADGATALVLACTELPLALSSKNLQMPVFDTTKILADAAVDFALK